MERCSLDRARPESTPLPLPFKIPGQDANCSYFFHNLQQAYSLGHSLSSTPFTHIYTSDLKRAHSTAQHVLEQQPSPHPPLTITPLLREQHFGVAEGYAWVMSIPEGTTREAMYDQKVFPVLDTRQEKFPEGESLDDIALRAEAAVRECILPHVGHGQGDGDEEAHIAIASHGLCISEVVAALVRLDPEADKTKSYRGLKNTAWARVEVNQRSGDATGLEVKVVKFNVDKHLDDMKDIPSRHENEDGASAEARAYFGGGAA
ncbi:hypothetical protein D9619_007859 [Psilocybe cf. subviscida]|uniref:Phosphoglycerate mutase-like protein n=1 Tax=Psilocybe cf. subviscida TaxID=2480587 RepID=A0A8H5AUM8_9AGAR|nr:hypothetical protein D9619_007859 [Psilocybe cf. subviscida]